MTDTLQRWSIIPHDEAEAVRAGVKVEWFDRLMDGTMLLMPDRPSITTPMRARMEQRALRMRTKQATPKEGFYVWFEGGHVVVPEGTPDAMVTGEGALADDGFDPLGELG